jgi:hypothetical protein
MADYKDITTLLQAVEQLHKFIGSDRIQRRIKYFVKDE